MNVVTDAVLLAKLADGTILVVDSGHTGRGAAGAARDALGRIGVRMLGLILNRSEVSTSSTYDDYYGAKDPAEDSDEPPAVAAPDEPPAVAGPDHAEELRPQP